MLGDLLVAMVESALILTVAYAPVSLRNFASKPRAGTNFMPRLRHYYASQLWPNLVRTQSMKHSARA